MGKKTLRIAVTCQGVSPLLLDGDPVLLPKAVGSEDFFPPSVEGGRRKPTPRQEAQAKADHYQYEDGDYFIPQEALWLALEGAGRLVRYDETQQITTGRTTLLRGLLKLEDDCVIAVPNKNRPWVTDLAPGRNPSNGQPMQIARPRFDRWEFTAYVSIWLTKLEERKVRALFDKAGKNYGLLYNRPALKGTNGQFIVKRWQHL
jgi:hypothetical protein